MHELMFQAGVKGMSERSELIPCNYYHIKQYATHLPFDLPIRLGTTNVAVGTHALTPTDVCISIPQFCPIRFQWYPLIQTWLLFLHCSLHLRLNHKHIVVVYIG